MKIEFLATIAVIRPTRRSAGGCMQKRSGCRWRAPVMTSTTTPTRSPSESGTATGTFSCYSHPTGSVTGKDTFRWSNGRKSVLEYHDTVLGFFGDTKGMITRGQFKGLHVHYQGPAVPTSLDPCTSAKGGTMHISYAGVGSFG
jgi:hypothetical protein